MEMHARRPIIYAVKVVASASGIYGGVYTHSRSIVFGDLSDAAIAISRQMKDREETREKRLRNQMYEDDKSPLSLSLLLALSVSFRTNIRLAEGSIMSAEISFGRIAQLINKRIQRSMPSIKALTRT